MSSVSNGLYFLALPLVSVMRVIYRKIRHARYLYIKRNVEKVWGARYTLGARYLSKNTVKGLKICHLCLFVSMTLLLTDTSNFAPFENGSYQGQIGMMQRNEAKLSPSPLIFYRERDAAADFVSPTWNFE